MSHPKSERIRTAEELRETAKSYVQPLSARAADRRFELRLHEAEIRAWRAMASARGVGVADLVRSAVRALRAAGEAPELDPPEQRALAEFATALAETRDPAYVHDGDGAAVAVSDRCSPAHASIADASGAE